MDDPGRESQAANDGGEFAYAKKASTEQRRLLSLRAYHTGAGNTRLSIEVDMCPGQASTGRKGHPTNSSHKKTVGEGERLHLNVGGVGQAIG